MQHSVGLNARHCFEGKHTTALSSSLCQSHGTIFDWRLALLFCAERHRPMASNSVCLRVKNLPWWAIHYFKPNREAQPQKHTAGIYYLDLRAPSWLSSVFMSFGVPQQPNSYGNSCVFARRDLLWRTSSSASIPNERQPVTVFSCGLSAVCPLVDGKRESTQQPLSPPEGQLHRMGSHSELLMIHMMA